MSVTLRGSHIFHWYDWCQVCQMITSVTILVEEIDKFINSPKEGWRKTQRTNIKNTKTCLYSCIKKSYTYTVFKIVWGGFSKAIWVTFTFVCRLIREFNSHEGWNLMVGRWQELWKTGKYMKCFWRSSVFNGAILEMWDIK